LPNFVKTYYFSAELLIVKYRCYNIPVTPMGTNIYEPTAVAHRQLRLFAQST